MQADDAANAAKIVATAETAIKNFVFIAQILLPRTNKFISTPQAEKTPKVIYTPMYLYGAVGIRHR